MRSIAALCTLLLVLGGCSSAGDAETSTTTMAGATTATTPTATTPSVGQAISVPPELVDHDRDMVIVGDRLMFLAVADSPALRAQGLMGVTDLQDLDGMLFSWRHEASGGFWMKDTLIPLDIVWFAEDGSFAGRASMVPCDAEPCEIYSPGDGVDFRYAIEARPGDLDWVDESTVIVYSD
jgi:uncharacterized membrane protein (UPF0127 family)